MKEKVLVASGVNLIVVDYTMLVVGLTIVQSSAESSSPVTIIRQFGPLTTHILADTIVRGQTCTLNFTVIWFK
jgi:hypothetical protein